MKRNCVNRSPYSLRNKRTYAGNSAESNKAEKLTVGASAAEIEGEELRVEEQHCPPGVAAVVEGGSEESRDPPAVATAAGIVESREENEDNSDADQTRHQSVVDLTADDELSDEEDESSDEEDESSDEENESSDEENESSDEEDESSDEENESTDDEEGHNESGNGEPRNIDLNRLKRMHKNVNNTHFFEFVMCEVLGIHLGHGMMLPDFVQFIITQRSRNFQVAPCCDIPFTIFGRMILGSEAGTLTTKVSKEIKRFDLIENGILIPVIKLVNLKNENEKKFYSFIRDFVRSGDISGTPLLLLEGKEDDKPFLLIPDYGYNLSEHINTFKCNHDKLLYLSVVATASSLPAIHGDEHEKNICVYKPDIQFCYVWTIRTSTFLIEISWITFGIITFIDWEFPHSEGKTSSSSSATFSYRNQPWRFSIKAIPAIGIEGTVLTGEKGMWILLYRVLSKIDVKRIGTKFCSMEPVYNAKESVVSILQVFPFFNDKEKLVIPPSTKNRWSQSASDHGFKFKTKEKLTKSDFSSINRLLSEFLALDSQTTSFLPFPSDTGLVLLKRDGTLVAAKDIRMGEIVTFVTVTNKVESFDQTTNPLIAIGMVMATVIKKLTPFGGFGAFTKWAPTTQANCSLCLHCLPYAKHKLWALRSTRIIYASQEIVCSNERIMHAITPSPNESTSALLRCIKEQQKHHSVETRLHSTPLTPPSDTE